MAFSQVIKEPSGFRSSRVKAEVLVDDISKVADLLHNAVHKANINKSLLKKIWSELGTLFRLLNAFLSGEYRNIPWRTMVLAVAAIVYFVNPFDLIPDPLPLMGFIDDSSVIGFVTYSISADLKKFLEWEKAQVHN